MKFIDREKFKQALADLNHPEATVWTHWVLEAYDRVHCPELRNEEIKMSTKHIMTRAEAIACFKKHMPDAGRAEPVIDFYVAAGMLEIKEEEKPKEVVVLFETIRDINNGVIRLETWPEGLVLWVNGKIKYTSWEDANK